MKREIKMLLSEASPSEWTDYLLEIQTLMLSSGCFLGCTQEGFDHHAGKFAALQSFFKHLSNTQKSDS
ncbi:MAG: hypothetical protein KF880_07515 [Ferruginibacter sp.]|nr:hypothetical protein [Ferruginibacter sp.]